MAPILRNSLLAIAILCTVSAVAPQVSAQSLGSTSTTIEGELDLGNADEITSIGGGMNVRETITNIIRSVLSYLGLLAVAVIVIGGVLLVIGMGSEDSLERTKKIVLYTLIGLFLILLAGAIVDFVATVAEESTTP